MNVPIIRKNYIFLIVLILLFGWISLSFSLSQGTIESTVKISICGNDIREANEKCDRTDLAGKTCQDFGYSGGTLKCGIACDEFDLSSCYNSGGGGGGGSYTPPASQPEEETAPETRINFSGQSYPLTTVSILKDGQLADSVVTDLNGQFNIYLDDLASGDYFFALFGEDNQGRRSSLFTKSIFVTEEKTTEVSGIFIAPTIEVNKKEVEKGENLTISGQSVPGAEVSITFSSESEPFDQVSTDNQGIYFFDFDTTDLSSNQHSAKTRSILNGQKSSSSQAINFLVKEGVVSTTPQVLKGDLNGDERIDLVDFSIIAYWYNRQSPDLKGDLNNDGKVDLVDFSIAAYYWTG